MSTNELVAAVLLKATGEVSTAVFGDDEYTKVLGIANPLISAWTHEPGVDWNSLYDPGINCGSISATDTYELDDTIERVSAQEGDQVYIIHSDGVNYSYYDLVPATHLQHYKNQKVCAKTNAGLRFPKAFTTADPEFGGTLYVPSFLVVDPLTTASDDVPVDDPQWLVVMSAAEYVRNDIVKQNQYPSLISEANNLMTGMKEANESQVSTVYREPVARGSTW